MRQATRVFGSCMTGALWISQRKIHGRVEKACFDGMIEVDHFPGVAEFGFAGGHGGSRELSGVRLMGLRAV